MIENRYMKILVNSLSDGFGGVESLFFNLVQCDTLSEIKMDFTCPVLKCAREEDFLALGVKVIYIPRPLKQFWEYIKIFRNLFKNGEYDIYHVNLTRYCFPLDIILAKLYGLKVVIHCHSTQIYDFGSKKIKLIRKVEQLLFRPVCMICSDRNIACSKNAANYLFGKKKYVILHNGINLERFKFNENARNKTREEFGIKGKKVIGYVGRMSSEKNPMFMLEILKQLLNIDGDYRLLFVGEGDLYDELIAKASQMALSDSIVFAGQRTDIPNLFSAMDVFVLPSFHEALPIVMIEAQANGVPCIISDCVTDELDIIHLIKRISLEEKLSTWTEAVDKSIKKREMMIDFHKFKDFDIKYTKWKLYHIYLDIMNNGKR